MRAAPRCGDPMSRAVRATSCAEPARRRDRVLPPLSAARRVAGGVGRRPAAAVRGRELLGEAAARLRRPGRAHARRRAGAGGARRQSHGPRLHRRPLGRLALRRASPRGYANRRSPSAAGDGLRLEGACVSAVNRCPPPANKPTPAERDNCLPIPGPRAGAARPGARRSSRSAGTRGTGRCARSASSATRCRAPSRASRTAPRSRSAAYALLGCFHPSQQNTFTGRLTEGMMEEVFERAGELGAPGAPWGLSGACASG